MKYLVVVFHEHDCERLFIFPATMEHAEMYAVLRSSYPNIRAVSAGHVSNFRDSYRLQGHDRDHEFDNVSLGGESYTMGLKSRPEKDTELFRRLCYV
jgi:hypothetical protein